MEATSRRWRGIYAPSSRCSYGDDVASMLWGVRNLISTQVNAMWQGKHTLYPATVKASHAYENSYDLDYDDGDAETRVPARYVRPLATAAPTPLTTTSRAPTPADLGEL